MGGGVGSRGPESDGGGGAVPGAVTGAGGGAGAAAEGTGTVTDGHAYMEGG